MPDYDRDAAKWAAKRRAEFALETALRRIDFTLDVIAPEKRAIKDGTAVVRQSGDATLDAREALSGTLELESGE